MQELFEDRFMKALTLGISLAAIVAATAAVAGNHGMTGADGDGDGDVTRAEMQTKASAMFDKLDVNNDGKLDPADREARMGAMFDSIDSDSDGSISRDEFTAHHQSMMGQGGPDGERGHHRGHKRGHGKGHGRGHEMGMMMMHKADNNNDGAVSRDEFMSAANARFDKADANKDGTISTEEHRDARQQWREKKQSAADAQAN